MALTISSYANYASQGGLGSTYPHVIPDSEYVMDELVTVHPYSYGGAITSSPDGRYAFCAEGGAVALILADPTLVYPDPEDSYKYPIWRQPVGSVGVSPVELAVDPDMDFDTATYDPQGRETLIYIAGGRDGLWVMNASLDPHLPVGGWSPHKAFRVDDSGNMVKSTQNGRKFCNDVEFMTVGSKTYVLALFSRVDLSQLRVYEIEDVRDVAQFSSETGNELKALIKVGLQSNSNASGDAYSLGMDVDEISGEDEAIVYVAMGEHGIFRVPFQLDVGGDLISLPVEHGPFFGDNSPYVTHGNSLPDPDLYDTVRYYPDNDDTQAAIFEHAPYFLDVAVENLAPGRHRLYAAVDHLGWCAFNLEATWDEFIWSPPSSAAPGYPDFIQEGKKVDDNQQAPKRMIRLINNPNVNGSAKNSFARRVEVVKTRKDSSSPESTALIVSASRSRHIQGSGWNEGRSLQWDLNQGPVPNHAQPPGYAGGRNYVLTYELEHVGDNTAPSGTPYWEEDGYNYKGASEGGSHIHAVDQQPDGELHLFYGQSVIEEKLDEPSEKPSIGNNMVRVWYSDWPDTIADGPQETPLPGHDDYIVRGRYFRLGRYTLAFGPSKIDPNILVASANDAGCIPDGPLIFDPVAQRISAPFRSEGYVEVLDPNQVSGAPLPINQVPGFSIPTGQADDLNYGVLMNARGGFKHQHTTTQIDHEYRVGFSPRITGYEDPTTHHPSGRWLKGARWKANRFNATYSTSGVVDSIELDRQIYMTTPSSKFSVSPYNDQLEADKVLWSGKPYYSTTVTFPEYNAYVASNFGLLVDPDGLMFTACNGSPQGLWVIAMSKLRLEVDKDPLIMGNEFDRLFLPPVSATSNEIIRGALVTHPEFWNVPDTRTDTAPADANYFTQRLANHHIGETAVWHPDMFQLPIPNTEPVEYAWVLAVPCGFAVLSENDDKFFNPNVLPTSWYPDPEFRDGVGYKHMMVRFFDMSNPLQVVGVEVGSSGLLDNRDSPDLPAYTLIGPDEETSAVFAKGIRVMDSLDEERFLLLVGDLGGKVYLYDIEDLLVPSTTGVPAPGHDVKQYGWFFNDAPLSTYETQKSLTDDHANGVWGCEVVQESWIDGNQVQQDETYVYLGVPRVGVEVAKLKFNGSGSPSLEYLGRIQTPGHAITLYVEEFNSPPPGYEAWEKLLYVSDYFGGMRIYSHPVGGQ